MSNLEKNLAKLPLRPVPAGWKCEILPPVAKQASDSRMTLFSYWLAQIYPGHRLMSGLGAAWAVILALHLLTPASDLPPGPPFSAEEFAKAMQEQNAIMVELDSWDHPAVGNRISMPLERLKASKEKS